MGTDESRELNDPAKVIALLNENRITVMIKLNKYFKNIDFHDNRLYESYKKILPAIWGVIKASDEDHFNYSREVIEKLTKHNDWSVENKYLNDWCMFFEGRSNSRKIHHNAKGLLGYENLQFFILLCKWLKYHKLHKYAYFFANITFEEFQIIDENSIKELEKKINMPAITEGGRGTILRHIKSLKTRILDLSKIYEDRNKWMLMIKTMLHSPIHVREDSELIVRLKENIITVYEAVIYSGDLDEKLYLARLLMSARSCYFFSQYHRRIFNDLQESCEQIVENMISKPIDSVNAQCIMNQKYCTAINMDYRKLSSFSYEILPYPFYRWSIPFKSPVQYSNSSSGASSSCGDGLEMKYKSYNDIITCDSETSYMFNKISTAAFAENINNSMCTIKEKNDFCVDSIISSEKGKWDNKTEDVSASLIIEISKLNNKGTDTFRITPNTISTVTNDSVCPHIVKTWLSNWEFNTPTSTIFRHSLTNENKDSQLLKNHPPIMKKWLDSREFNTTMSTIHNSTNRHTMTENEDSLLMKNMLRMKVYLNSLLDDD